VTLSVSFELILQRPAPMCSIGKKEPREKNVTDTAATPRWPIWNLGQVENSPRMLTIIGGMAEPGEKKQRKNANQLMWKARI